MLIAIWFYLKGEGGTKQGMTNLCAFSEVVEKLIEAAKNSFIRIIESKIVGTFNTHQ